MGQMACIHRRLVPRGPVGRNLRQWMLAPPGYDVRLIDCRALDLFCKYMATNGNVWKSAGKAERSRGPEAHCFSYLFSWNALHSSYNCASLSWETCSIKCGSWKTRWDLTDSPDRKYSTHYHIVTLVWQRDLRGHLSPCSTLEEFAH